MTIKARPLDADIGLAVARRTVFRPDDHEDMANVAKRVASGNVMLAPHSVEPGEYEELCQMIAGGVIPSSGRHLQQGDADQKFRNLEIFTNCATAATSFSKFYLLLNGSGVGRSYDDAMMVVDWAYAPTLVLVLSEDHPDYPKTTESWFSFGRDFGLIPFDMTINQFGADDLEKVQSFFHANIRTSVPSADVVHRVGDSREGWAKGLEIYESMTYAKRRHEVLVLEFSDVRRCGSPIAGMQNRPASGPLSIMRAFINVRNHVVARAHEMKPWMQNMFVDHYFSVEVQVGGARRAARLASKDWRDPDILDFIKIKTEHGLWTGNNSVTVDQDFWTRVGDIMYGSHIRSDLDHQAFKVFKEVIRCSYVNGEPGFLNGDLLEGYKTGKAAQRPVYANGEDFGSARYQADASKDLLREVASASGCTRFPMTVNPCVTGSTRILTSSGYVPIRDLVGREVKVWNGKEFSNVTPFSTGSNQVYRVSLSDGTYLDCTGYHKWVLAGDERVETLALKKGDRLQKFAMPVIDRGIDPAGDPYTQGFYSGDGCSGYGFSWVYDTKFACLERLGYDDNVGERVRVAVKHTDLLPKNYVPVTATLNYRLHWLAGLMDSDGTVIRHPNSDAVQISSIDLDFLRETRLMLTTLGVQTKIGLMKPAGDKMMPDGKGGQKSYPSQDCYRLLINSADLSLLLDLGLVCERLRFRPVQDPNRDARRFVTIEKVEQLGEEETFCFNEPINHTGCFEGIVTAQCGEVELHVLGGYCVIGDVIPLNACPYDYFSRPGGVLSRQEAWEWDEAFCKAVALTARFLIRVNLMDALYGKEVMRTNRIGVSLTGIHEYAWARFGFTFHDLLDVEKSEPFWKMIERASRATKDAANAYAKKLGVAAPHTVTTIKPAGTTSKLYGLTEGAHLPAFRQYLRWVQYRGQRDTTGQWKSDADPLLAKYETLGYPVRELQTFDGMSIIGFPTVPLLTRLMGADKVVTAPEASPEDQYQWLSLLEMFWIGREQGNQISYTLKVYTDKVSENDYAKILIDWQPNVKACTVMPSRPNHLLGYEYLPEEEISEEQFAEIMSRVHAREAGDIDMDTLLCVSGACPI